MVDYIGAVKRPFSDFKKLSIGALMYLIPVVNVITMLFAFAYHLLCSKTFKKLPEWKNWQDLFVKGFKAFVLVLLYFVFIAILVIVIVLASGDATLLNEQSVSVEELFSETTPGFYLIVLLAFLMIYCVPMALIHYAQKFNIKDGLNIKNIFRKVFTRTYFITWIFCLLYSLIGSVIVNVLISATEFTYIMPLIINAYWSMILGITLFTLYGQTYKEIK